jgi:hypothetical protein
MFVPGNLICGPGSLYTFFTGPDLSGCASFSALPTVESCRALSETHWVLNLIFCIGQGFEQAASTLPDPNAAIQLLPTGTLSPDQLRAAVTTNLDLLGATLHVCENLQISCQAGQTFDLLGCTSGFCNSAALERSSHKASL